MTNTKPNGGWKARGDTLMLRPIKRPEVSTGGIILPNGGYRETNRGIVVDKGDQTTDLIPHGAEVFFPQNTEWRIEISEDTHEEIIIVRENDVLLWRQQA